MLHLASEGGGGRWGIQLIGASNTGATFFTNLHVVPSKSEENVPSFLLVLFNPHV